MAEWLSKEKVYLGDALGNAVEAWIGVVKVNRRTSIGLQINRDNRGDLPDYTLDEQGAIEFSSQLLKALSGLAGSGGEIQ
jgi:hypothetical protein